MKDLTIHDAENFWDFFMLNYPEIFNQLAPVKAFVGTTIWANKPAKMSESDYDTYNMVKDQWLKDNGFLA